MVLLRDHSDLNDNYVKSIIEWSQNEAVVKYPPSVGSVEGASKNEWVKGASVFNNKK